MIPFLVFSWNIQVLTNNKCSKDRVAIGKLIYKVIDENRKSDKSIRPFVGFILEVNGSEDDAIDMAKMIVTEIKSNGLSDITINYKAVNCLGSSYTQECIIVFWYGGSASFRTLDVQSTVKVAIEKDKELAGLKFLDDKEKVSNSRSLRSLVDLDSGSKGDIEQKYEIANTAMKWLGENKKEEYNRLMLYFNKTTRVAELQKDISLWNLSKMIYNQKAGVRKIEHNKFHRHDASWFRNGVVCDFLPGMGTGKVYSIGGIHAPGPNETDREFGHDDVSIIGCILSAAKIAKVTILIGDLNYRGSISKVKTGQFADLSTGKSYTDLVSKEKKKHGTSIRKSDPENWSTSVLDKICVHRAAGIRVKVKEPLHPGFNGSDPVSDHGLILGIVSRLAGGPSLQTKDKADIVLARKKEELRKQDTDFDDESPSSRPTGKDGKVIPKILGDGRVKTTPMKAADVFKKVHVTTDSNG